MSFASSSSSTLVPILPKYPTVITNSAGYVQTLTLIDTPTDTGTPYNVVAGIPLPEGVWLLAGGITFQSNAGGQTTLISALVNVNINGVAIQQFINSVEITGGAPTNIGSNPQVVVSALINSGDFFPNAEFSVSIQAATTAGGQFSIQELSPLTSLLRLIRVA
jgi:hypothetical protein